MPGYCLVPGCKPSMKRVSYHSLPRNQELARHWLEICGRKDLIGCKLTKSVKICSAHFHKTDFKSHYQYTLMKSGMSGARPRLKDDAVPTFVTLGWKKIRTVPPDVKSISPEQKRQSELRRQHVSDALREYEAGQLDGGDTVQAIRCQLKMRRAARQPANAGPTRCAADRLRLADASLVDVVQVDRRGSQLLVGGTFSQLMDGAMPRQEDAPPLHAFASRSLAEVGRLGADTYRLADDVLQPPPPPPPPLPPHMPAVFRDIVGRQRRVRDLQRTLGRQAEQFSALQARHCADCTERGYDGTAARLFPPLDPSAPWRNEGAAGGHMLLSPSTLDEACAQLHRLRTEVLQLRARLLETAVAANERALAANEQRAALLRSLTPHQSETLLGRPPPANSWGVEDLRRAIALRRQLTRRQYQHVRTTCRLPLPPLRASAAQAQKEPQAARLYRLLLEPRYSGHLDDALYRLPPRAVANRRLELLVLRAGQRTATAGQHWEQAVVNGREPVVSANESSMDMTDTVSLEKEDEEAELLVTTVLSRPVKLPTTPSHCEEMFDTHESLWAEFL